MALKTACDRCCDGTKWRVWPADVPANLAVVTDHRIGNAVLNDGFCSHELINLEDQSRVTANDIWPAEAVQRVLDESQT